jgi:CDP-glycerol glycerophosphotransferase (TagB/SpsB family)
MLEEFLELEKELNLFNKTIQDVKFWHLVRFGIYNEIQAQKKPIGQAHTSLKDMTLLKRLVKKLKQIPDIFLKSPILLKQKDILILNHPRRVRNGDVYECLYTDMLIKELKNSYIVLEDPILDTHMKPIQQTEIRYTDYIYNLYLFKRILFRISSRQMLNESEKSSIRELIELINSEFNVDINIEQWVKNTGNAILEHKIAYKYFNKIIDKIKPKIIIEVVSYKTSRYIVNELAKKKNIPTIELQHGTMGKNHIAYNIAEKKKISTLPDYIFLFGKFWKDTTCLPLDESRIKVVGWPNYEQKLNEYKSKSRKSNKKVILFISQGTIGKHLSKVAVEISEKIGDDYKIIYKLHPGEYARWKKEYPWLIGADVEVIDNNNHDIHYYFAQADIQVGVYSTAIFEGLGYGLKTIIWKLYGYGHMQELYCKGYADLVDNVDEFMMILNSIENLKEEHDIVYFWKKNSLNNIIKELDEIIMKNDKWQKL